MLYFLINTLLLGACGTGHRSGTSYLGTVPSKDPDVLLQKAVIRNELNQNEQFNRLGSTCSIVALQPTHFDFLEVTFECNEDNKFKYGPTQYALVFPKPTLYKAIHTFETEIINRNPSCRITEMNPRPAIANIPILAVIGYRCKVVATKTNRELAFDYSEYSAPSKVQANTFVTLEKGYRIALSKINVSNNRQIISKITFLEGELFSSPSAILEYRSKK